MKIKAISISFLIISISLFACKKKTKVSCNGTTPTYNSYVKSVVQNNCVSCHSQYGTYSGLKSIVDNGSFESEVLKKQSMPQDGSLSSDELNTLKCWVENGAPEN